MALDFKQISTSRPIMYSQCLYELLGKGRSKLMGTPYNTMAWTAP
jgi:hypothetical protein